MLNYTSNISKNRNGSYEMKKSIYLYALLLFVFMGITFKSNSAMAAERIHFLPVGGGDAILLESNGRFALIDGGEDYSNFEDPNQIKVDATSYDTKVKDYLKKTITNTIVSEGQKKYVLDFVIATHPHSDHIGVQREIVKDSTFQIGAAYIKDYGANYGDGYFKNAYPDGSVEYEWDNRYQYKYLMQALEAKLEKKNIHKTLNELSEIITLGNMKLKFYNTVRHYEAKNMNENEQSLVTTVTYNNTTALLTSDLDNQHKQEDHLIAALKADGVKVDILKLIHHGDSSNGADYIKQIANGNRNMIAVVTGAWMGTAKETQEMLDNSGVVTYVTGQQSDNGLTTDNSQPVWRGKNQGVIINMANATKRVPNNDPIYQRRNAGGWKYIQMKTELPFIGSPQGSWVAAYRQSRIQTVDESKRATQFVWLLVDSNGNLKTDWQQVDGKWFYLKRNEVGVSDGLIRGIDKEANKGEMLRGWLYDSRDGKWFYLRDNDNPRLTRHRADIVEGEMITGWAYDECLKNWVYFKQNSIGVADSGDENSKNLVKGAEYMNGTFMIDGQLRTFNADGYLMGAK